MSGPTEDEKREAAEMAERLALVWDSLLKIGPERMVLGAFFAFAIQRGRARGMTFEMLARSWKVADGMGTIEQGSGRVKVRH